MGEFLVGSQSVGTVGGGADVFGGIFTCQKSGLIDEIQVYTLNPFPGNVKAGIYEFDTDDSATGNVLSVNNSGVYCPAGQWNSVAITPVQIVEGEDYWLCTLSDAYGVISAINGGADYRNSSIEYADGLPSSITWQNDFSYTLSFAGFGTPSGMSPMLMRTL